MRGLFLLFLLTMGFVSVHAQYFGRNKVVYEKYNFRIVRTDHFEIHHYLKDSVTVLDAARMAERWYFRLSTTFEHYFREKKPIVLYADLTDFQQTNIIPGFIGQGVGGFTEAFKNRLVMPLSGIYGSNDHVLGHEMVHEFQYDIAEKLDTVKKTYLHELPLWFIEGMAEYLSVGRYDPQTAMYLRDAMIHNKLPNDRQLTFKMDRYNPYQFGQAFWAFIGGKWGDDMVVKIYHKALFSGYHAAFDSLLKIKTDSLFKLWHQEIRTAYKPVAEGRTLQKNAGKRLLAPDKKSGRINLSPALSPDGRYVAFLSEKNLFSIELFLADARSGKIIKKLTKSDTDPHYEALSFLNSCGTWSPEGNRFAFVAYSMGKNELVIMDVESRHTVNHFRIEKIDAIADPAWSPDGKQIVFSGVTEGVSDLYALHLDSGRIEQLTNDRYAEIQPCWSPDGKQIAFVTDRSEVTDFSFLYYSSMQIALLNVETKQIQPVQLFSHGNHINPQFSPDGKTMYFISDTDGFSDIYSISLESREIYRITQTATGVTGITETAPAMSIARKSGDMAFSVFENNSFIVYAMNEKTVKAKSIAVTQDTVSLAGILPPIQTSGTVLVQRYLKNPERGLEQDMRLRTRSYKPRLSLDYIGQVGVGIAFDRFGTAFAGGIYGHFSDILGDHRLGVAIQGSGNSLRDLGGQALYLNLQKRTQWGVMAGHIPFVSAVDFLAVDENGSPYLGELRQYTFIDQVSALAFYPLSSTKRAEITTTYSLYNYQLFLYKYYFDGSQTKTKLESPPALHIWENSVAYVGDYSYFGFTAPVKGGRYRLEAGYATGSLNYLTTIADYRRYFFVKPVTFAVRGIQYNRFGSDASSNRLEPLFLGYETLLRGYSFYTFEANECGDDSVGCPAFDRLLGTRMGVANAEIRFPLFGVKDFGLINFPYLPVELAAFADAGVAWTASEPPVLEIEEESPDRIPVFSAGFTARINLSNVLVLHFYYAYPFQRPLKGWHWGFFIYPGW